MIQCKVEIIPMEVIAERKKPLFEMTVAFDGVCV